MSAEPDDVRPDAEVAVPGPAEAAPEVAAESSYEIDLDHAPPAVPVPVDLAQLQGGRQPIVPVHLRTRAGVRAATVRHAQLAGHRAGYHGLRAPRYLLLAVLWAFVGIVRLVLAQVRWWWMTESHGLRNEAAADGDSREWMRLHKEAKETRRMRGMVLAAELAAVGIAAAVLARYAPGWAWIGLAVAARPRLARAGRPADRRIVSPAVVTPRFRRLSADIVLRAYYSAGLGHPDKPDQQVMFGGPMHRDGEGSRVLVDLPYGRTTKHAMDAKDEIASGLDVTESQVFIHRDPTSYRRHVLWVADRDPLAVPVGRTPLLACRPTDIWRDRAPLGLDERGQLVSLDLLWISLLIGALPRQGKTFVARAIALFLALDPFVRLSVFDASGKPDWRKFALVADSCAFGLTPTRAGLPPEILLATLENIKADVQDRYERLSAMPTDVCPQGKLTREIARDPRYNMPYRAIVLDEVQEYFDLGNISAAIADLLVYLAKVAPGAGVDLIDATQRPSGIGSGQVAQRFTAFRDNHQVRFSLRTSDYRVSEMVLGAGAYGEGLDSSTLLPEYKGVGILRGATDASPTVRTYLADGNDAERILIAARGIRERAGTLSGMALGEADPVAVSIAADVLAVLGDRPAAHWEVIAGLLRAQFPDRHADATAESVSAQCRAADIPSVDVKMLGRTLKGCRRDAVLAATR
jgi:S-DNA-T family DNA segregation ATPase FtsK/SpoIIIE